MGTATSYSGIVGGLEHASTLQNSKSDINLISKSKVKGLSSSTLLGKKPLRKSHSADSVLKDLVMSSPVGDAVAKEAVAGASDLLPTGPIRSLKGIAGMEDLKLDSSFSASSIRIEAAHTSTCPRQLIVLAGPARKENRKILNDWIASQCCEGSPQILGDADVEYKVVMPMHWKSLKCKEVTELQYSDQLLESSPVKQSLLRCPVIVYTLNFQFYKDKSFAMRSKLLERIEVMLHDFEDMASLNWVKKSSIILLTVGIPKTDFFGSIFGKTFEDSDEFFDLVHTTFQEKFAKMTFVSCNSLFEVDFKAEVEKNIALFQSRMTGRTPMTASSALSTPGTVGSSVGLATPGKYDPAAVVPLGVLELVNSIDEKP